MLYDNGTSVFNSCRWLTEGLSCNKDCCLRDTGWWCCHCGTCHCRCFTIWLVTPESGFLLNPYGGRWCSCRWCLNDLQKAVSFQGKLEMHVWSLFLSSNRKKVVKWINIITEGAGSALLVPNSTSSFCLLFSRFLFWLVQVWLCVYLEAYSSWSYQYSQFQTPYATHRRELSSFYCRDLGDWIFLYVHPQFLHNLSPCHWRLTNSDLKFGQYPTKFVETSWASQWKLQ